MTHLDSEASSIHKYMDGVRSDSAATVSSVAFTRPSHPRRFFASTTHNMRVAAGVCAGLTLGLLGTIAYAAITPPGTGGLIAGCYTTKEVQNQHFVSLLD